MEKENVDIDIDRDIDKDNQAWMKEEAEKRDATGAVVGLSGGVDSAVVAGLIKGAFGDNTLGVLLPSKNTAGKDVKYAKLTAETFDLDTVTVNIKEQYETIYNSLSEVDIEDSVKREYYPQTKVSGEDVPEQNIQTRLRMLNLYYVAEKKNYLVMGTSNQSEIITGYYTLYGDGGTDLRPLGNLSKTQVWALAENIGVPQEIIERPPTGGIRAEDTDKDEIEIGLDYRKIDRIYKALQNGYNLDEFDPEEIERVKEVVTAAKDKEDVPMFKPNETVLK
jgi:NAD+ synthase